MKDNTLVDIKEWPISENIKFITFDLVNKGQIALKSKGQTDE